MRPSRDTLRSRLQSGSRDGLPRQKNPPNNRFHLPLPLRPSSSRDTRSVVHIETPTQWVSEAQHAAGIERGCPFSFPARQIRQAIKAQAHSHAPWPMISKFLSANI